MGKLIDLTEIKFGRLTVLRRSVKKSRNREIFWWVKCACGKEKEVLGSHLKKGLIKSCGCYHREVIGALNRLEYGLASKRISYRQYRDNARHKQISFELSFEYFLELTKQDCHYCGSEPLNFKKSNGYGSNGGFTYNGIDRIDNTKGYTKENSITCCKICNFAKRNMFYDEFISWGKKLGDHLNVKEGNKMELEKEMELLREKLSLLEKIKRLQDEIKSREVPSVPYIPIYPQPYIIPSVIFDPFNPMPIYPMPINPVEDPWYWSPNITCSN